MRSGRFGWTMRHGAKILFFIAIIQFAATVLPAFTMLTARVGDMAGGYQASGEGRLLQLSLALQSIGALAIPLFAALVIDRMDRWLASRAIAEPRE